MALIVFSSIILSLWDDFKSEREALTSAAIKKKQK